MQGAPESDGANTGAPADASAVLSPAPLRATKKSKASAAAAAAPVVPKGSVTATSATASAAAETGVHAKTGVQGAASSAVSDQGARQTRSKRPEEDTADTEVGVVVASSKGAVKVFLVSPKALAAAAGERERESLWPFLCLP